jgi:hypothetical protein
MTISWIAGAALALLLTGVAFAQTPPAPTEGGALPPPPELAPGAPAAPAAGEPAAGEPAAGEPAASMDAEAENTPEAGAADAMRDMDRARDRRERRDRRRAMREHRRGVMEDRGDDEQYEWRDHHRGMGRMGMRSRGPQGAVFRFSRGEGGPSIVIRCADRDTTQECVDAIGPMLQMMLPNAR